MSQHERVQPSSAFDTARYVLTQSWHLAAVLIRLAMSYVLFCLVVAGILAVLTVLAWSNTSEMFPPGPHPAARPPVTMEQVALALQAHKGAIAACLLIAWAVFRLYVWYTSARPMPAWLPRGEVASTARHEAGHALVAFVLGVPVVEAQVNHILGSAGGVVYKVRPGATDDVGDLYASLVRTIAVYVAGAVAERPGQPVFERVFRAQSDWTKAGEVSWIAGMLRPESNLLHDAEAALQTDLNTPAWKAAIAQAAKVLLRARGLPVRPELLSPIASAHALTLPSVLSLMERLRAQLDA